MKTLFLKTVLVALFVFALSNASYASNTVSVANDGICNNIFNPHDSTLSIEITPQSSSSGQANGQIWVSGQSMADVDFDIYMDGNMVGHGRTGTITTLTGLEAGSYHITISGPFNSDSDDVTIVDR